MDVKLYAWSAEPVMSGRLGMESEYRIILFQTEEEKTMDMLELKRRETVYQD
jgi:hypothetical protein